jgi:LPS-assembly protein
MRGAGERNPQFEGQSGQCGQCGRFQVLLIRLGLVCLAMLLGTASLQAQEGELAIPQELKEEPILFSADEVTYDEDLGTVTARGNVELNQAGRTLLADTVSYNRRSGVVTATGNVSLVDLDGTVYFAEYVELADDLREGFIRQIGVLMADRTRIAAASGTRKEGRITVFRKAVFSPCELCREDPSRAPLWQLKADQVIHDQEERSLTYRNARLEFYGVPVAYPPYFKHPDPTVDRQTGFLAPTFGSSSDLGLTLEVPYYWNISPDVGQHVRGLAGYRVWSRVMRELQEWEGGEPVVVARSKVRPEHGFDDADGPFCLSICLLMSCG